MPPVSEYRGPAAGRLRDCCSTSAAWCTAPASAWSERLAEARTRDAAGASSEIGGIASDRDELWQQMLRRQVTEREYWAQRAAEFGAAVGETWDTRALMDRFYQLPEHEWLCAPTIELMTDAKAAGLRVGALTNDMTAFHGPEWVARQEHLKLFDVIVDASLTGVMKPDPRAFRDGAEALGVPAEQIVFLDDMPWNAEGARQAGMTAVRVPWDDPAPAIDTARELLRLGPR